VGNASLVRQTFDFWNDAKIRARRYFLIDEHNIATVLCLDCR